MLAGPGKTARHIAKQLGFNEILGYAAAVNLDKGRVCPQAVAVDMPRHNILAHAGFTQQQHGGVCFCNGRGLGVQALHDRALHHAGVLVATCTLAAEILKCLEQFALGGDFFAQFCKGGNVAYDGNNVGNLARGILNRMPIEQQRAPVVQVLHA